VQALTGDGHAGSTYRLTGPVALRPAEQVTILGEALGRPLQPVELSLEESYAELRAAMPPQYADAIYSFFGAGTVDETTVNDTVEQITGHQPRTLQTWVTENATLFS
jgi:uncharacterized protein YbjT (DUF2867 family)